ncbi:MAG TPA: serine/threonine-protein kinase [Longimicrobiaceae bacterium]|nr:serine/threonine-protein kinase [Longimicrobiaceae bacterium]
MTQAYEKLLLGRSLAGRYEVREVIGRGGMSLVFRGVDRVLDRPVAVKVVALPAVSEEMRATLRQRFRREAGSAARIPHHPNVVQIYDYGTDPELDLDFIVMELLVGRDLKELLATSPPPPRTGVRILREAARGLAAGHRVGIVHRDVKPANLFLEGEGEVDSVRILDFGIAKPLDPPPQADLTRTGQFAYSPAYASPEQLRGQRHVTPASDVYQLGLIGYELLAGTRPFDAEARGRIGAGEDLEVPVLGRWASLPTSLRAVIERALRMDPDERFADATEFAEALSDLAIDWNETVLQEPETRIVPPAPSTPPPPVAAGSAPAGEPPSVTGGPLGVAGIVSTRAHAVPPPPRRRIGIPSARWAVPLLMVAVLAILLARGASRGDDPAGAAAAVTGVAAPPAGEAADSGEPPGATRMVGGVEGEVRRVVEDLNRAWVEGDLSRHVGHYASRVDYYNSRRLPRSGVRRDRRRDLQRYPERQIEIHDLRVEVLETDRVRVLVDKSWRFYGPEHGERNGRGLQEYVFKRDEDDGEWYVVSEQLLEETERRTPPREEDDGDRGD